MITSPLKRLRDHRSIDLGFHSKMAVAGGVLLFFSILGCRVASITGVFAIATAALAVFVLVALAWLPAYLHEKGKIELRDSILTLPWGVLYAMLIPVSVAVSGRLGMHMSLKDDLFAHLDQTLGVNVPAVMAWGNSHWLGNLANQSYPLLILFLPISFLLPALTGRARSAQELLTANFIAFAIGLPLFALLPAVGPWQGYHFSANQVQRACQDSLLLLRSQSRYVYAPEGVVCFPSFHVIWAILSARALWSFRLLRIPASILSALIVLSTLTTGWHYFVDVLSGSVIATIAIAIAAADAERSRAKVIDCSTVSRSATLNEIGANTVRCNLVEDAKSV